MLRMFRSKKQGRHTGNRDRHRDSMFVFTYDKVSELIQGEVKLDFKTTSAMSAAMILSLF